MCQKRERGLLWKSTTPNLECRVDEAAACSKRIDVRNSEHVTRLTDNTVSGLFNQRIPIHGSMQKGSRDYTARIRGGINEGRLKGKERRVHSKQPKAQFRVVHGNQRSSHHRSMSHEGTEQRKSKKRETIDDTGSLSSE